MITAGYVAVASRFQLPEDCTTLTVSSSIPALTQTISDQCPAMRKLSGRPSRRSPAALLLGSWDRTVCDLLADTGDDVPSNPL